MRPAKRPTDVAVSVRARLKNLARERSEELQLVLVDFAIERFLYRLGCSRHAESLILKGATLFKLWSSEMHRATWDLDLQGRHAGDVARMEALVRELCSIPAEDAIVFDIDSVRGEGIRAATEQGGVRVRLQARLAGARIPLQVDIGFGDAPTPAPRRETYPTLLDHAPPVLLAYPREAVVAEKLDAMISLGVTGSRMKDFYDVYVLASSFAFDGSELAEAIRATFGSRGTPIPGAEPLVLTPGFLAAPERQVQWRAFLRRGRLEAPPETEKLAEALRRFLGPVLLAAERGEAFGAKWPAGGPWRRGDGDV